MSCNTRFANCLWLERRDYFPCQIHMFYVHCLLEQCSTNIPFLKARMCWKWVLHAKSSMCKKRNWSATQCILLSGLNMSSKKVPRGSEQWRLPSLSVEFWVCPFFIMTCVLRRENTLSRASPGAKRKEESMSGRSGSVQALWYPQDLANLFLQMPVLCMIYLAGCGSRSSAASSRLGAPLCQGCSEHPPSPLLPQEREEKPSRILVCFVLVGV